MTLRTMYALTCGDIVHQTFMSTFDEGIFKSIWIFVYILLFYTAAANLLFAIMLEGYDRA